MYLVYILIFPGLLFSTVFGLYLAGIDRKVVARMQKRTGPPVLQPAYDFFKLLGKETIVPGGAARRTFLIAPYIGLASLIVTVLFIPIGGLQAFGGMADMVVILYLITIPSLAMIFGGSASASPYAGVGVGSVTFSLEQVTLYQQFFGSFLFDWRLIPAALAMLLVIPCEVGAHPFDVGEAETEICEGPLVEYSGAPLAVFKLSHAVKMFVMTALFTALFLGGISTGMLWLDVVIAIVICTVVTLLCMTLLHAVTARLKVEQMFKFFWTVVSGLALVSLLLVWFVN